MAYYRRTSSRPPLTPPADLVGQRVSWRPKDRTGKRMGRQLGYVTAYDPDARTLTLSVQQAVSMWQPNPERSVTVPLSSGPFTVAA